MPLPRRKVALPAVVVLAAVSGCALLSSLLDRREGPPDLDLDSDQGYQRDPRRAGLRRGLATRAEGKLMNHLELVAYDVPGAVQAPEGEGSEDSPAASDGGSLPPWYRDIRYDQRPLCGSVKCFFLSVRDPSRGYLVWEPSKNRKDSNSIEAAVEMYEYATRLETEFEARQFFTGPPTQADPPKYFRRNLQGHYRERFLGAESLIVQPSRTAPEGSIVFRCYSDGVKFGRLRYFVENARPYARQRLLGELEYNVHVIRNHEELVRDFQIMIDPEGRIYHLDFDRILNGPPGNPGAQEKRVRCLRDAQAYILESMGGPPAQVLREVRAEEAWRGPVMLPEPEEVSVAAAEEAPLEPAEEPLPQVV